MFNPHVLKFLAYGALAYAALSFVSGMSRGTRKPRKAE